MRGTKEDYELISANGAGLTISHGRSLIDLTR